MNPPVSAALGTEARNRNTSQRMSEPVALSDASARPADASPRPPANVPELAKTNFTSVDDYRPPHGEAPGTYHTEPAPNPDDVQ